jgi:ribosomal protein L7/L12
MSHPIPQQQITALRELLFRGRKIEAIKLYRELSGLDLKRSKEAVEELEASLRQQHPDRFAAPRKPAGAGCLVVVVVLGIAIALAAYRFLRG